MPLPEEDLEDFDESSEENNCDDGSFSVPSLRSRIVRITNRSAPVTRAMSYRASDMSDTFKAKKGKMSREINTSARLMESRFKPVDLTKEMAETYYHGRQDFKQEHTQPDEPNLFWLDFVQWNETQGRSFLSHVRLWMQMSLFCLFLYA